MPKDTELHEAIADEIKSLAKDIDWQDNPKAKFEAWWADDETDPNTGVSRNEG